LCQAGTERIAFHVSTYLQKMLVGRDWKRLEPALVQVSRADVSIRSAKALAPARLGAAARTNLSLPAARRVARPKAEAWEEACPVAA
jgi:hypothetical protein